MRTVSIKFQAFFVSMFALYSVASTASEKKIIHKSCSGFAAIGIRNGAFDSDLKKINNLIFDVYTQENSSGEADDRTVMTLSAYGFSYSGSAKTDNGRSFSIELTNSLNKLDILFTGKVEVLVGSRGLKLMGKYSIEEAPGWAKFDAILECSDIQ